MLCQLHWKVTPTIHQREIAWTRPANAGNQNLSLRRTSLGALQRQSRLQLQRV